MSWTTDVQTVTSNVKSTIIADSANIQNAVSSNANKTIDMIDSFFTNGYSIVGINANAINDIMCPAIDEYIASVKEELEKLNKYDPNVAFKGTEIVPALNEYIESVKFLCSNLVSRMMQFKEELRLVQAAYESRDTNTASNLRTQSQNASSAMPSPGAGGVNGG